MIEILLKKTRLDVELWKARFMRSGFFLVALLLHLILFLMLASYVVWKASDPSPQTEFKAVAVTIPPPPPKAPSSGDAALNSQFEPQQVVVPVATPPAVFHTVSSSFNVNTANIVNQSLSHVADRMAQGSGLTAGAGNAGIGRGSGAFGSQDANGGLAGDFYDLKQTADGHTNLISNNPFEDKNPNDTAPGWPMLPSTREEIRVLKKYISSFNDSILQDYYHAPTTLFAPQIFIPELQASEAPKAFGVEKAVKPRRWIVVYKAQIIPPVTGEFRFVGFADDYMVVRFDGQNVLDACWDKGMLDSRANDNDDAGVGPLYTTQYGKPIPLACGRWIHMTAGLAMDFRMLIGEGPGGQSCFFLFIQQKGVDYAKGDYPVFQVSDVPIPPVSDRRGVPPAFSGKKMVFGLKSN